METLTAEAVRGFDNSTPAAQNAQIAQRVQNLETGTEGPVQSVAGRGGAVVLVSADITDAASAATASKIAIRDGSAGLAVAALTATTVSATGRITGGSLKVSETATKSMGAAVLVGGTVTVLTAQATSTMRVFHSRQSQGTLAGHVSVSNVVAGVSFDLISTSVTDDGIIAWLIIEPGA